MSKTYLRVRFSEKDIVKALGARWDVDETAWFVPEGVDTAPFKNWMPDAESTETDEPWVKSKYFFILLNVTSCWKCNGETPVFAIAVPKTHIQPDEEILNDTGKYVWEEQGCNVVMSHIQFIDDHAAELVKAATGGRFRPDYSSTLRATCYMNHCKCCGEKQGDHFLHDKPGAPFFPLSAGEAININVIKTKTPISVDGNMAFGTDYMDYVLDDHQPRTIRERLSDLWHSITRPFRRT